MQIYERAGLNRSRDERGPEVHQARAGLELLDEAEFVSGHGHRGERRRRGHTLREAYHDRGRVEVIRELLRCCLEADRLETGPAEDRLTDLEPYEAGVVGDPRPLSEGRAEPELDAGGDRDRRDKDEDEVERDDKGDLGGSLSILPDAPAPFSTFRSHRPSGVTAVGLPSTRTTRFRSYTEEMACDRNPDRAEIAGRPGLYPWRRAARDRRR